MMRSILRLAIVISLCLGLVGVGLAQDASEARPRVSGSMFGGSSYPGGHLKYTYKIERAGVQGYATATTEITPQGNGLYRIESSSTDVVPLDRVTLGFFGIPLRAIGIRVPMNTQGTVDLSPLEAIASDEVEPNSEILLPDGGYLITKEAGTLAGLGVVFGTYTHADYTNVRIQIAIAQDVMLRPLLPVLPLMELEYIPESEHAARDYIRFGAIELIEFTYEPEE